MGALLLLPVAVVLLGTIAAVKHFDQRFHDRQRKTYRLGFPSDMDAERVAAWVRSISGTLRSKPVSIFGVPTVAFEMWSDHMGITHRLKVPWQHADYVIAQLRILVPGIRVTPETEFPGETWTRTVEIGLTHKSRVLHIYDVADTAASLLAAVQPLGANEKVIVQWVVTPAIPEHKPVHNQARSHRMSLSMLVRENLASRDEVNDRRDKLDEPNMLAVLRIAAVANTRERADHLIYRVRASLASTRGPSTRFVRRLATHSAVQRRIQGSAGSLVFPIQLSAPELAALVAWPIGNPQVIGLHRPPSRQFPPIGIVPSAGIVIGHSSFPGSERPIAIGYAEALMHIHCLGKTGTGKSVLLSHIGRQIMETGHGLIVMETEGNLYQSILDYVPASRVNDVVLMDVADQQFPVGFNILDQGNPATVIDEVMDILKHKFGRDGLWSREYIYHGLRTIVESRNLTFIDLVTLLSPTTTEEIDWLDGVVAELRNEDLRRWWQRHANRDKRSQQQRADPVLSRIWEMTSRPELRHILGQAKSTFQIRDVLRNNKILLINLKGVSKDTASLSGTLLMNAIWHAAKNVQKELPTYLILDEFGDFMDLPIGTESILAQARKHKLGMVLANQHMSQLTPSVRDAVISNTRTKIIFEANTDDGRLLSQELYGEISPQDITSLEPYHALVSVLTPNGSSGPVSIATAAPGKTAGTALTVRFTSRKQYGRPVQVVADEIAARYIPQRSRPSRPRLSDMAWY